MASKNISLPELGEGVTEGELVKWLVKVGDRITADQPIAEMMTDKATVEVPSPSAGVVRELKGKEGDVIAVGQVMVVIEADAGGAAAVGAPNGKMAPNTASSVSAAAVATASVATASAPKAMVTAASPGAGSGIGGTGGTKSVQLPELGEGVTEGELVKWLVKVGDRISADQPIAEMMTDKATVEVPSPSAGVVRELKGKEGDVITVGQVMVVIETSAGTSASASGASSGASSGSLSASRPQVAASAQPAVVSAAAMQRAPISVSASASAHAPTVMSAQAPGHAASRSTFTGSGLEVSPPPADVKVLATPATRRLAREMGVDINLLKGSGIAGRVTREDVLAQGAGAVAAGTPAFKAPGVTPPSATPRPAYQGPQGAPEERVALRGIRKKIAENLQLAKQIVPHFTLMDEANVTALVSMREDLKAAAEKAGVKVTYLPFVMKALIATMRDFPQFNASIDDAAQEIVYKKYFNIGFAADTPNGLVVPVVKNADQKSILQISKEINDLAKRARDGKLTVDEMKGATITITNIGSVGGSYATPIINHPEVAILGMYKIQDKPVIKGAVAGHPGAYEIDVVKTMNFTITADHRLIDGAVAANFLKAFFARIENPGVLMLDMM